MRMDFTMVLTYCVNMFGAQKEREDSFTDQQQWKTGRKEASLTFLFSPTLHWGHCRGCQHSGQIASHWHNHSRTLGSKIKCFFSGLSPAFHGFLGLTCVSGHADLLGMSGMYRSVMSLTPTHARCFKSGPDGWQCRGRRSATPKTRQCTKR